MPTFRLLVAANATVLHNHKLSCDATTMAELEQAVLRGELPPTLAAQRLIEHYQASD